MLVAFVAGALAAVLVQGAWAIVARAFAETDTMSAPPDYSNPVIDEDFPDPHVIRIDEDAKYLALSTNSRFGRVPIAESGPDFEWRIVGDAMPQVPAWAVESDEYFWAPAIARISDHWILYFTGPDRASGRQCIGAGVSVRPDGPFDPDPTPLVCQDEIGGSIDPVVFDDDDGAWLLWKNDGNCCGQESWIWSQRLAPDGRALEGEPMRLITVDQSWEANGTDDRMTTIEAPYMVRDGGTYYLFYSGNGWATADYATGWATCRTPRGPCSKSPERLLVSDEERVGPGGASVFQDADGRHWIAYHAWSPRAVGPSHGYRSLHLDQLVIRDGRPIVVKPTATTNANQR